MRILSSHNLIPRWKSWLKSTGLKFVAELGKVDQLPTVSQGPQGQVWQAWLCSWPCHHHNPRVPLRWRPSQCTEAPQCWCIFWILRHFPSKSGFLPNYYRSNSCAGCQNVLFALTIGGHKREKRITEPQHKRLRAPNPLWAA